jgi:hypothetical protein
VLCAEWQELSYAVVSVSGHVAAGSRVCGQEGVGGLAGERQAGCVRRLCRGSPFCLHARSYHI